jgi:hypothetical protein
MDDDRLSSSLATLDVHGFTVVRSYFTDDELKAARTDFEKLKKKALYKPGELSSKVSWDAPEFAHLRARVLELIEALRQHTRSRADLFTPTVGTYLRSSRVGYGLHVDTGPEFQSQGTDNCMKFWIPLVKSDPNAGGVTFVRMDKFREREPKVAEKISGRGAIDITEREVEMVFGPSPERLPLQHSVSEILETPEVRVGDVLLFRSDTIHGTQELSEKHKKPDTERVAWSFAIKWSEKPMYRQNMYVSPHYRGFMGRLGTAAQLACFWSNGKDEISFGDYAAFEKRLRSFQLGPLAWLGAALVLEPMVNLAERRRRSSSS